MKKISIILGMGALLVACGFDQSGAIKQNTPAVSTRAENKDGISYEKRQAPKTSRRIASNRYDLEEGGKPQEPVFTEHNTEQYDSLEENRFLVTKLHPLSTFSIDVDTASYSNVRRFLMSGTKPPKGAVRIEELVNYFEYDYPEPKEKHPIKIDTELTRAPWNTKHHLLRVALQAKKIKTENLPPRNLVFLLDVSGSMSSPNKLPLLKKAFRLLVQGMRPQDTVAIAVYAGASGVVLKPTDGSQKQLLIRAMDSLRAGGSTNGASGIRLAYQLARQSFRKGGINRIMLGTDGDFNVGVSNRSDLVDLIKKNRDHGIALTILGFGMGNYKDATMEELADQGNGNYAYIDTIAEARKVLVEQAAGTLYTLAKDVKIQMEFNPAKVSAYRLIGYENRALKAEDFKDDKKDAGELGAGHTVTALYELVPAGSGEKIPDVDDLKYTRVQPGKGHEEIATVKVRYKRPKGRKSIPMNVAVKAQAVAFDSASENTRFAASVAMYGMLLRNSKHRGSANYKQVYAIAKAAQSHDPEGYRAEFLRLGCEW